MARKSAKRIANFSGTKVTSLPSVCLSLSLPLSLSISLSHQAHLTHNRGSAYIDLISRGRENHDRRFPSLHIDLGCASVNMAREIHVIQPVFSRPREIALMHVTSWSESYPLRNCPMGARGFRPVVSSISFVLKRPARLGKAKPGNAHLLTTEDDIRGASL